jgi:transcriptional regulator with XRE-family HTH domain
VATHNPTRAALGRLMRELRTGAGLTPEQVEAAMDWYRGQVSRLERGGRTIVLAEAEKLADMLRVDGKQRTELLELTKAARKRERAAHVADFAQSYVTYERQASVIDYFDDVLIPAIAQTEGYARALLSTSPTSSNLDERVADRVARRGVLTKENPPAVRILLGEAVLHTEVGGPGVMRDQLKHLLDVTRMPNVSIRIMPFAVGAHRALGVGFRIVTVTSPAEITRVYLEGLTSATYIHESNETNTYQEAFAELWQVAASDRESATILRRRINT